MKVVCNCCNTKVLPLFITSALENYDTLYDTNKEKKGLKKRFTIFIYGNIREYDVKIGFQLRTLFLRNCYYEKTCYIKKYFITRLGYTSCIVDAFR